MNRSEQHKALIDWVPDSIPLKERIYTSYDHIVDAEKRGAREGGFQMADYIFQNIMWSFGVTDYNTLPRKGELYDEVYDAIRDLIENRGLVINPDSVP